MYHDFGITEISSPQAANATTEMTRKEEITEDVYSGGNANPDTI